MAGGLRRQPPARGRVGRRGLRPGRASRDRRVVWPRCGCLLPAVCSQPHRRALRGSRWSSDRRGDPRARVGHHVANSRTNPPWGALFYGTKRRASYVDVCAAVFAGQYFPGDEFEHYALNPERVRRGVPGREPTAARRPRGALAARRRAVYPDATAAALIEQDVLEPWTAHSTATYRGQFTRRGPNRQTFEVATDSMGLRWPASSHQGGQVPGYASNGDCVRAEGDVLHRSSCQGFRQVRPYGVAPLIDPPPIAWADRRPVKSDQARPSR